MRGQSSLESLIAVAILVLVIAIFLSSVNEFYKEEVKNNEIIQAKVELENLALRSNFISTSTAPYTKTPFNLPAYVGYTGGEITKTLEDNTVSAPILSEIGYAFGEKRYVANRLEGEPI